MRVQSKILRFWLLQVPLLIALELSGCKQIEFEVRDDSPGLRYTAPDNTTKWTPVVVNHDGRENPLIPKIKFSFNVPHQLPSIWQYTALSTFRGQLKLGDFPHSYQQSRTCSYLNRKGCG